MHSIRNDALPATRSARSDWLRPRPSRALGLPTAAGLVAVVAVLDYLTGYEQRLAILYMLPIALATWTGGLWPGMLAALAAAACWGVSFHSNNLYTREIFYYWEWLVLVSTFCIFVLLLSRLRDALARADRRFLHVLEGLHAGIYVMNESDGSILYANQEMARMTGADPLSPHAADFERRFHTAGTAPARDTAGDGSGFHYEEVRDAHDGRWYLVQSGRIPWENDERVSLKVVMDISEQKQAQQLRRQHEEMLQKTARFAVLAEIASVLAHEINQPLMAIAGYTDACELLLSRDGRGTPEVIEALDKCRAQALRAGRIIDRMREFLRSRVPSPANCDINEVVAEALQSMEIELEDAGVAVDLRLADALPRTVFDRTLIAQVVVNLLRNAVDAVRDAPPSRREVLVTTGIAGGAIAVGVADRGAGIAPDIAERLFAPFFTTKPQGLGLGLCICRSVVEAHAGRLWHEDNPGGGTCFHFTLPGDASE